MDDDDDDGNDGNDGGDDDDGYGEEVQEEEGRAKGNKILATLLHHPHLAAGLRRCTKG